MNPTPKIVVVIPVHNRKKITLNCLERLQRIDTAGFLLKVVVVEDGSTDGTAEAVAEKFPHVTLLRGDGNLWWTGATRLGVEYALNHSADYVLTLNDDVGFNNDFLIRLFETAVSRPDKIICPLVCDSNEKQKILSAGRCRSGFLGYRIVANHADKLVEEIGNKLIPSELESGYAMLIPVNIFHEIGNFDGKNFPHHMGDMDFVLRARDAGYTVIVNPKARVFGRPGGNYIAYFFREKSVYYFIRALFDIKSTIFLRTRIIFMFRYSIPRKFAFIAVIHFLLRMAGLIFVKAFFPGQLVNQIAVRIYGRSTYGESNSPD